LSAGFVDFIVYSILYKKQKLIRVNGPNVFSAGMDSLVFPLIAFGFPLLVNIVILQFIVKVFEVLL